MVFPCFSPGFCEEFRRVNDLRHLPEKLMACALQIAKQVNYSPESVYLDLISALVTPDLIRGPSGTLDAGSSPA